MGRPFVRRALHLGLLALLSAVVASDWPTGILSEFWADHGSVLVVDLREVTFLGASAITALLVGASEAPNSVAGPRLVVGGNRLVGLVVDVLDLPTTFSIHHNVADALHGRTRPPVYQRSAY